MNIRGMPTASRIWKRGFIRRSMLTSVVAVFAVCALLPANLALRHVEAATCTTSQITDTITLMSWVGETAIDAAGNLIAFKSYADLTGNNPDGSLEIFLFDVGLNTFTQVTNTTTSPLIDSSLSVSGDGNRIAFVSNQDLTGNNSDVSTEVFLFEVSTNTLTQITDSTGGGYTRCSLSGDGNRIAFSYAADLIGNNSDSNNELFLFDIFTNSLTQVTDTQAGMLWDLSIDDTGSRLAFSATYNISGGNADGNVEIFLFDNVSSVLTQITNTAAPNSNPLSNYSVSISGNGTRLAFSSRQDLTGNNPDRNLEIFLFDAAANTLDQITNTIGAPLIPHLNANGNRIAFVSCLDFAGSNPNGNREIFLVDILTNSFTQITSSTGNSITSGISINASGSKIAFKSNRDSGGHNSDGNVEVFLTNCVEIPPPASDIWVHLLDFPDPVASGREISYDITIGNNGPDSAAATVLTDQLPRNTTFVSLTQVPGWTCSTPERGGAGVISCSARELAPGATVKFTLVIRVDPTTPGGTTINNTVQVSSETPESDNRDNVSTTITVVSSR